MTKVLNQNALSLHLNPQISNFHLHISHCMIPTCGWRSRGLESSMQIFPPNPNRIRNRGRYLQALHNEYMRFASHHVKRVCCIFPTQHRTRRHTPPEINLGIQSPSHAVKWMQHHMLLRHTVRERLSWGWKGKRKRKKKKSKRLVFSEALYASRRVLEWGSFQRDEHGIHRRGFVRRLWKTTNIINISRWFAFSTVSGRHEKSVKDLSHRQSQLSAANILSPPPPT